MNDQAILDMYNLRSETAITATQAQYGAYCHSIAFRILNNTQDSEECVNETFLRAWNAIPPACPENLKLFLGKITRRLAINLCNKRHAEKRSSSTYALVLDELAECIPSTETPDVVTDAIVIRDTLNAFLELLSPMDKTLFLQRYWHMTSITDLAQALHITENHVHVRLHRIRLKLRTTLEKEGVTL